jgi:hypothetical protein
MNITNTLQLDTGNKKQNLINPISISDLDTLDTNSVLSIDCFNILEKIDDVSLFLTVIKKKLRLHGECTFSGTSLNLLSEYYLDNLIDINFYNSIIAEVKRLYTIESIVETLRQSGFVVKIVKTYEINYYIVVSRATN